ncbi:protein PFC0760c-like [Mytilus trossulus]|uniref:protein PFC0760c-like n=1 Tax=Mytilus trossulus TaxID=6551 RepID=UPI0030060C2D
MLTERSETFNSILKATTDINLTDSKGNTVLHKIILLGEKDTNVSALVEKVLDNSDAIDIEIKGSAGIYRRNIIDIISEAYSRICHLRFDAEDNLELGSDFVDVDKSVEFNTPTQSLDVLSSLNGKSLKSTRGDPNHSSRSEDNISTPCKTVDEDGSDHEYDDDDEYTVSTDRYYSDNDFNYDDFDVDDHDYDDYFGDDNDNDDDVDDYYDNYNDDEDDYRNDHDDEDDYRYDHDHDDDNDDL